MGKAWLWVISASALAAKSLGSLLSLCGIHSTILPHLHSTFWVTAGLLPASWSCYARLVLTRACQAV